MASPSLPKPAQLAPSLLGTKEYWDALYTTEISNHAADPSDVGTIWFDDSRAEDKILSFLHSPALGLDPASTSFLDIGTGNGHFLLRLREPYGDGSADDDEDADEDAHAHAHADDEDGDDDAVDGEAEGQEAHKENRQRRTKNTGFKGRIVGTDYSAASIELARRVAAARCPAPDPPLEFLHYDIMSPLFSSSSSSSASSAARPAATAILAPPNEAGYDVVLDKGTFDAVSLCADVDAQGRRAGEQYREGIVPLVRPGGVFVVTSCNWTEGELRAWFEGEERGEGGEGELVFETALAYRSFRFGGREGQSISSVCFRKRRTRRGS